MINANNSQLMAFRAAISDVGGHLTQPDGGRVPLGLAGLRGTLLYSQPRNVYVSLMRSELRVAEMGSNEQLYWMWHITGAGAGEVLCYVGAHERWNPQVGRGVLPVHPLQMANLLGVDVIGADGTMPVLRQSEPQDRATVIQSVQIRTDGSGLLLRELWIDRDTNRAAGVRVFDERGQVSVQSWLSDWRPVRDGEAIFPHRVTIQWYTYKDVETTALCPGGVRQTEGSRLQLDFAAVEVDARYAEPERYEYECPHGARVISLDGP